MRLIAISRITLLVALIAMVIGHTGSPRLDWRIDHISTYAARGPRGDWITAAMVLLCFALACVGIVIWKYRIVGDSILARTAPMFLAAAMAGLLTLAIFQESPGPAYSAIRRQSFHNAGLWVFFYCAIYSTLLLGFLIAVRAAHWKERMLGVAVVLLGLASFPLMMTRWTELLGIRESLPGLAQRMSFSSLWLAFLLVVALASRKIRTISESQAGRK